MKVPWAVACGWLVGYGVAAAGEYAWQPVAAPSVPAPAARPLGVSLGRPVCLADAVSLSPPTPSNAGLTRISYNSPADAVAQPLVRMQNADSGSRLTPTPQAAWSRMPSAPVAGPSGFAAGAAPPPTSPNQFAASDPVRSQPVTGFGCGDASGCGSTCCDGPCCCCPDLQCCPCPTGGQHWYTSAEYLLWFIRGGSYPPLVTASPAGTPFGQIGVLSPGSNAQTLFGGNTVTNGPLSGARVRLGYWFDDCQTCGLEGSFFFLAPRTTHFQVGPTAALPNLGRPFFDPNGQPDAEVVAAQNITGFPGGSTAPLMGTAGVTTRTSLWGADFNYRQNLCCTGPWRFDGLAGARYLNLSENVNITEQGTLSVPTAVAPFGVLPAGFSSYGGDSFSTQNQFYGGQVGFLCEYRLNRWVVDLRTTLALGDTHQSIQVVGAQINTGPAGSPAGTLGTFPGNLLSEPSNIGLRHRDQLSFVPEVGINLGYQVTDNLKLFVGYNFLFWTNVVRPGDQIDTVINTKNAPPLSGTSANLPPLRPMPLFNSTNIWVQGVNLGLQYRF